MCINKKTEPCVSLIGMAGVGKTTIGAILARQMGWAFMDSDNLLEALYAARLQDITDALGKEAFLDAEAKMICTIRASRCVIATGGSVVYRPRAMEHLKKLGPIVHVDLPLETIKERIARNPERGLAMAPGQSLEDIFNERQALYANAATLYLDTQNISAPDCACRILELLRQKCQIPTSQNPCQA